MGLRQRLAAKFEGFTPPRPKVWDRWTRHDPDATEAIDHGAWARFLESHLRSFEDGMNLLTYSRVSEEDSAALDDYVNAMGSLSISRFNRAQQLAYWINLYNARTVQLILAYYPVDDIRYIKISPGRSVIGPWDKKILIIEGESLSLSDVENRILRPQWRDHAIPYALNRAALGSPNLQPEPFSADNAQALFEKAARAFVNHRRGARFEDGRLTVSKLYLWYASDFGGTAQRVLDHLRRFAGHELGERLAAARRIDDYEFYWELNDAP